LFSFNNSSYDFKTINILKEIYFSDIGAISIAPSAAYRSRHSELREQMPVKRRRNADSKTFDDDNNKKLISECLALNQTTTRLQTPKVSSVRLYFAKPFIVSRI
jgi:hypothetical protein